MDLVSGDEFSEIFGGHLRTIGGFTEWEAVIGFGDLGVDGGDGIHLEFDLISNSIVLLFDTRNVECIGCVLRCQACRNQGFREDCCHGCFRSAAMNLNTALYDFGANNGHFLCDISFA